ncbi:MAG: hypothetical protein CSB01_01785 [Bacteroidia bacterium]|nr:MAG: hypothetical protein CSB01_01785 [Bacteroidia bacterium]
MFKLIIFSLLFSGNLPWSDTDTLTSDSIQKRYYEIESAHILYKISGNSEGKEELFFDEWGAKEVSIRKTKTTSVFYSVKTVQEEHTQRIILYDESYGIDLKKKIGTKTKSNSQPQNTKIKDPLRKITQSLFERNGAKKIGTEIILGKECEVFESAENKIWFWKKIPLKIVSGNKYKSKNTFEAVEMDIDIPIDSSVFSIPPLIEIFDNTDYPEVKE